LVLFVTEKYQKVLLFVVSFSILLSTRFAKLEKLVRFTRSNSFELHTQTLADKIWKFTKEKKQNMEQEIIHPENYPEEYKTWNVTFFGREFCVTPDVLIPRLETESLVRRARTIQEREKYARIVDIGCGSGIIGTSIADLADEVVFLDISPWALSVAEGNFRRHYPEARAQFLISDLLSELPKIPHFPTLYLANLPYIKWGDWEHMSPDTRYEPAIALFGGDETGFELYIKLFEQIQVNNYRWKLIIEFGFDQREIAEKVIQKYSSKYQFFPDYSGMERFLELSL
jgi:release factor glutamine methyltransferase